MQQKTVIIIAGPTAVGKTGVAMQIAANLGTAIVSADSRQCYTSMAIGTAQPAAADLQLVKHYFVNEFSPEMSISAAAFERLALGYLDDIFTHNNYAVVCGGTGLYIKALCEGLDEMPSVAPAIEQQINEQYQQFGLPWLQAELQRLDPNFFNSGEISNPHRLQRALSFITATGESITAYRTGEKKTRPFKIIKFALDLPRPVLYDRINKRVDLMLQAGLLEEVRNLYQHKHLKNLNTVGYSELFEYLDGKCTLDEATEKIKQHSRNYAKRQLTWFRKDKEFMWIDADQPGLVNAILKMIDIL